VTGASGFIGRYIVRALDERGARVVGVVRSPEKLAGEPAEPRRADLADVEALARAFEGCDAVVSNAGVVSIGQKSRDALMTANVEGTRNVFEAMARAGVRRALMTSSASVYARKRGGVYSERDPLWSPDAHVSRPLYYALSKAVAEREAWRLAGLYGIDLSTARPSGVYGARDKTGFTSWLRRFASVPLMTVFPTHLYIPTVYAGDLAEAMVRMLERPCASGKAYNVVGDPDVSFWDLLDAYRAAGGRVSPVVVPVPVPLRFAYAMDRARRELGFENRPPVEGFRHMLSL
jgi:nucleoside-diphosphate-sugar epimerase